MPLYEYRCRNCGKKSIFLVGVTMSKPAIRCSHCESNDLQRLISRVHHVLGEDERMEKMLDPSSLSGIDENDPRSIARWARKMGKGLGDEVGEDFDSLVDEMEETAARDIEGGETSSESGFDEE
jgi:putative FmdB family regulatory protein